MVMKALQFTRDEVMQKLAGMDANQADKFLNENFEIEQLDVDNIGDYNKDVYNVYVHDLDLDVLYIDGEYQN